MRNAREVIAARASASGRTAGASARRHRRSSRGAAARRPHYMSLCGERALRAVVTDSQWRRRPTVCPTAGTAARVAPPRCTPPAPLALRPLLPPHYTRPAPKNFPHRAEKSIVQRAPNNFGKTHGALVSSRSETAAAPLPAPETVKRTAFHSATKSTILRNLAICSM